MKKLKNVQAVFLAVAMVVCLFAATSILSGCSLLLPSEETEIEDIQRGVEGIADNHTVDLIIYLDSDDDVISAYTLTVNIPNSVISLSNDSLFTVSGGLGWQNRIYPVSLSSKSVALPSEPIEVSGISYSISNENELFYDDYVLIYNDEESQAELKKGNRGISVIDLTQDDMSFAPQAFFVDNENRIVLLCNTIGNTFDKVNPVSLIYTSIGESYSLEVFHDYSSIFDDYDLVKINMPNYTGLETNIYGNAQPNTFLWNEGANIIEINPYDGTVDIVLTVRKIETDMPHLDTHRDFYGFFSGAGYQNGVYLAKFPNYNNSASTIAVLYSNTGEFIGSLICSDDAITYSDGDNIEQSSIENAQIKPLLYIP